MSKVKKSESADGSAGATAVIYLRVSTKDQAKRGGEDDGFSLPVQQAACEKKASEIGARVVGEFKDAGESAKSADRDEFQKMLAYIAENHVDYVIVHKVDRFARNHEEAVMLNMELRRHGARLVSVSENIDDTPSGKLMHIMLSGMAQYYIDNLAAETMKGTKQKVARGGTPFRAPLGYLNVRENVNGYEVRTIAVDPERAPHIRWLFEQYATGEWSLQRLAEAVTTRGLTTRPTRKRPAQPVTFKLLHLILQNRYYIGYVTYQGIEYEGKHEPLIDRDLFQRVQDMLSARSKASERPSKHQHYLTGTVRCRRCHGALIYNVISGNGGRYDYFTCSKRLAERTCDLPYIPVEKVEQLVEDVWQREAIEDDVLAQLERDLGAQLDEMEATASKEARLLDQRIAAVKAERVKWAESAMNAVVPSDIARDKQRELEQQLTALQAEREQIVETGSEHRESVRKALDLLRNSPQSYATGSPTLRRAYNQACYDFIEIDHNEDEPEAANVVHTKPIAAFRDAAGVGQTDMWVVPSSCDREPRTTDMRVVAGTSEDAEDWREDNENARERTPGRIPSDDGSNETALVAGGGFEPPTSGL